MRSIREYSLIKHTEINFDSILSITYLKEMPIQHTHTQHTLISYSFGIVKFCSLEGEGRTGWESLVKNGVIRID